MKENSQSGSPILGLIGKALLVIGIPLVTVWGFSVPPSDRFQNPDLARILFFHLPCALGSSFFLMAGPYFAFRHLRAMAKGTAPKNLDWDIRAMAAMEMGFLQGILTLATGMIFSKVQWGEWWNWDPRQTSFLLVMMIVAAYFALRGALADPERRAQNSSAYLLASLLPVAFLVFVYPKLPQVESLHPNLLAKGGGMGATYSEVFFSTFAFFLGLSIWIYRLRVRASLIEFELELQNAELANRDRPAATGVVRPVSLSGDGG